MEDDDLKILSIYLKYFINHKNEYPIETIDELMKYDNGLAYYFLGRIYDSIDDSDKSISFYRKAALKNINIALQKLSYLYKSKCMNEKASLYLYEYYKKTGKRPPECSNDYCLDLMIKRDEEKASYEKAIEELEKEIEKLEKENTELRLLPHQEIQCNKCGNKIEVEISIDVINAMDDFKNLQSN